MLEIEFEQPVSETCDCCGMELVRLTRFVYKNGDAFGVYYARFTKGHPEKVVFGLIGLGGWGEDRTPHERLAFPFRIWTNDINYQVGLMDAKDSPWQHVTFLGRILNREEALKHDWVRDVFHLTDHIVTDDELIVEYFNT